MQIAANIIDFFAALIQIGTGAVKKKSRILILQIVQLLMQGVAMLLLGGVTGAVSNVLSCVRNYICYKEKLNLPWKLFFIIASIVMTVLLNDQGILGMIPAAVCIVYIIFMDVKDPIRFKLLVMITFIPWLFYHFILGSYTGAASDAATIVANIVTIIRMRKERKEPVNDR
ncbi:YgjV family protein [Butyrivibrio sp. VCD2006]|uniref:YgjV family protein n=1 Tax=Butyrivibrio sp. VCD2006 TaxID=1280664 RepID=UPI0004174B94|nr:YgjV family protein [Butyrivibrio sp. VCD2006]